MNSPNDDPGWRPTNRSQETPDPHSGLKVLLIMFIGIPVGLVALATLVLGVCFLSMR